jgi:hypothetical protein
MFSSVKLLETLGGAQPSSASLDSQDKLHDPLAVAAGFFDAVSIRQRACDLGQ